MDPNANLAELRTIYRLVLTQAYDADGKQDLSYREVRLAELIEALDGWLQSGGFLPEPWRPR